MVLKILVGHQFRLSLQLLMRRAYSSEIQLWPPLVTNGHIGCQRIDIIPQLDGTSRQFMGSVRAKTLRIHGWSHDMPCEPERFFDDFGHLQVPHGLCLKTEHTQRSLRGFLSFWACRSIDNRAGIYRCHCGPGGLLAPIGPVRASNGPRTADHTSIFIRHPHGPTRYLHNAPYGTLKCIRMGSWNPVAKM